MQKKLIYLITGLILIAFWLYSAGRNDVSNIRERANTVRDQLETAQEEQRDQVEALNRAEEAADNSQSAVRDSQRAADRVQELERSDAEIISESQSIIERVRERGQSQN